MTSGRAVNCLEARAAQQAPSSQPVGRSDQDRHGAAAQPEPTPPGKSKVKQARMDCYVRAEIVQMPSPSSLELTRRRSVNDVRRRGDSGGTCSGVLALTG